MRLPKRHRNHQLETESVREFQSLLPSTWVYRTPTDDYGIDGEVEIFDGDVQDIWISRHKEDCDAK